MQRVCPTSAGLANRAPKCTFGGRGGDVAFGQKLARVPHFTSLGAESEVEPGVGGLSAASLPRPVCQTVFLAEQDKRGVASIEAEAALGVATTAFLCNRG